MKKIIALLLAVMLMSAMTVQTFAMQIFVKDYDGQNVLGKTMTLEVDTSDTIAAIKAKILEKTGIAPKQQKLFWDGTELTDDTKTLEYYDIGRESTLKLDVSLLSSPMNNNSAGTYYIGVSGTYASGANADDVISVDVAWDPMNFTYSEGTLGTWSPENHSYSGGTEGGWSTDKAGITVTNHSNVGVDATFKFEAANGVTTTGSFYASANATTALTAAEQKISLVTAIGTAVANAPKGTIYFGVSGDAIGENKPLGNITVNISKERWTEVTNETELKSALEAGGKVKLATDIELANQIKISMPYDSDSDLTIVLDLNGYAITDKVQLDPILFFGNESECNLKVTIKDTSANQTGKIAATHSPCTVACTNVYTGSAEVTVDGGTISGSCALNVLGKVKAVINAGTLCCDEADDWALGLNGGGALSVVINNGTVENKAGGTAIYTCASTQTLEIAGGKIAGGISVDTSSPATITITGGTYSFDPAAYVDTENCTVTDNGNGTFTVSTKTSG